MTARASAGRLERAGADAVLEAIRSRRVVREFTAEPLTKDQLDQILTAGPPPRATGASIDFWSSRTHAHSSS